MTSPSAIRPSPPDAALGQWLPAMVVLAVIWGSSFLFIKVGVAELHPLYVAFGRLACGALALSVVVLVTGQRLPREAAVWGHSAVVGVFTAAPFSLFAYGEQRVSSVLAGIWNATTPLVVLPMAVLVFRTERFTPRKVTGLMLGFLGALVILGIWRGVGGASLSGQMMCFAAAACYGVGIPYQKRFLAGRPESGAVLSLAQLILASAFLAVVAPAVTGSVPDPTTLSWQTISSVVVLGAVGTGLAFLIHLRNIRLIGATVASMVTYIVPVFATLIGVLVLREELAWFQPIGAVVVLIGVAISQGLFARPARVVPAEADPVPTPEACQAVR